jgi:hypothetical protein
MRQTAHHGAAETVTDLIRDRMEEVAPLAVARVVDLKHGV